MQAFPAISGQRTTPSLRDSRTGRAVSPEGPRLDPRLQTAPANDHGARTAGCDCRETAVSLVGHPRRTSTPRQEMLDPWLPSAVAERGGWDLPWLANGRARLALSAQCSAAVRWAGHGGYLRGAVRPGEQAPGSGHGRQLERHAIPLPGLGKPASAATGLLHGFTGNARHSDTFARVMAERYRVLALDQRGHGETDWAPDQDYLVARVVADFAASRPSGCGASPWSRSRSAAIADSYPQRILARSRGWC